jgi:adenosine deaminase
VLLNLDIRRVISVGIVFAFFANGLSLPAQAADFPLPQPGVMVRLSPEFNPAILKGIRVHPDNPFRFDFILDQGDGVLRPRPDQEQFKTESTRLVKYFLASLTIPERDLWVNLSPYEKDRIIPQSFGLTEMGRDLLAEDYMLKQITASLVYPEGETGKRFWKRIYQEASKKFGTTDIPVNTFNKVWIVPEKAVVYENAKAGTAYIVESGLKVMLEQDYLAFEKHAVIPSGVNSAKDHKTPLDPSALPQSDINALGSKIVREIVIPELTKEVNEGKNFARLRQVYQSLILAAWYKKEIKNSILTQVYADRQKVAGINIDDPQERQRIYEQYLRAFKKGVYNYIKDEADTVTRNILPRKYFSGGFDLAMTGTALRTGPILNITHDAGFMDALSDKAMSISVDLESQGGGLPRQNLYSDGQSPGFSDAKEMTDFLRKFPLPEGHVHFGSSVPKDVLWELAVKRTELNWDDINQELSHEYGMAVDIKGVLNQARAILSIGGNGEKQQTLASLKNYFFTYITFKITNRVDLRRFNTIYKIIGLLTRGSPKLYQEISRQIALENYKNGVRILIQRATLPVGSTQEEIYQKTLEKVNAIKNGFAEAEREINSKLGDKDIGFESRLVFTVERYLDLDLILMQTRALLRILEEHDAFRRFIVGFDVADNEGLKTPTQMLPVVDLIHEYNAKTGLEKGQPLALTYHVGEDFKHVSLESAVRHVDEVLDMGAAGIGHGLVIGVNPERFLGKDKKEHVSERLTQIYYDLKNAKLFKPELDAVGLSIDENALWQELESYSTRNKYIREKVLPLINDIRHGTQMPLTEERRLYGLLNQMKGLYPDNMITIRYDEKRIEEIKKRQKFVLNKLIEKRAVIEVNPTVNVLLGPIKNYKEHPLPNFLGYEYTGLKKEFKKQRPVVSINTDNPTIVGVDLIHEYVQVISAFNLTQDDVAQMIRNGIKYRLGGFGLRFGGQIKSLLKTMKVDEGIDRAMLPAKQHDVGGIDFNSGRMNLQYRNGGGEIRFHLNPALLQQLQNTPGFVPVITSVQPADLRSFLGLAGQPH